MPGLLRNLLNLATLLLLTVVVTAIAADLASQRPSLSQLSVETRSRLVADYSADRLAQLLEPLSPEIIRAAAEDEAALGEGFGVEEVEPLPTPAPSSVVPTESPIAGASATPAPTASPEATSTPVPGTSTPGPSSTPAPPTAVPPSSTPALPTPTYTPPPTFTPTPPPTSTPPPTATPSPTSTPPPTSTQPPPPTSTPPPTATPKPGATPELCDLLPVPPPLCVE